MRKLPSALILAIGITILLMPNTAPAQRLSSDGAPQTFAFLSDQYFSDVYFRYAPTAGTSAGLHQYDNQLEDYSAASIQKQVAALHDYFAAQLRPGDTDVIVGMVADFGIAFASSADVRTDAAIVEQVGARAQDCLNEAVGVEFAGVATNRAARFGR